MKIDLKNNIKTLLGNHSLSMKSLAEKSGVSYATISNIINRNHKNISAENLVKLALFFNVSVDTLLFDNVFSDDLIDKKNNSYPSLTLSDFISNKDISSSNIFEINTSSKLSKNVFVIILDKDFYPYKKDDKLYFDKIDIELIKYPSLCVIQSNKKQYLEHLHLIDNQLFVKEKPKLLQKKDKLIHLQDRYANPNLEYALIEVHMS